MQPDLIDPMDPEQDGWAQEDVDNVLRARIGQLEIDHARAVAAHAGARRTVSQLRERVLRLQAALEALEEVPDERL